MKRLFPSLIHINIPNTITISGVLIGMVSLAIINKGCWQVGLCLYAFTFLCDDLDGFMARKLNKQSEFGKQLDSLSDFCNFCFIPGMILYKVVDGKLGYLLAMGICLFGGILRLAYFNTHEMCTKQGKSFFTGMPTTMMAAYFYICISIYLQWPMISAIFLGGIMILGGLLMISNIPIKKHGFLTKVLYIVIPVGFILNIIR